MIKVANDLQWRLDVIVKYTGNGMPQRNWIAKLGLTDVTGKTRAVQVSVIAQENLKLAAFLFHHQWRCTFVWEILGVIKETVCFLADQKKLKDEYKDPDVLPKINKSDMEGLMESIKE